MRVLQIISYKLKDILYKINSTAFYKQLGNLKMLRLETFYVLMSLATMIAAAGLKYDVRRGLEYTSEYHLMLLPFVGLAILRVIAANWLSPAPKEIQDKYWRTQLLRFKDPKAVIQYKLYPDAPKRERALEIMWKVKYNVSVNWTIANSPDIMKARIAILFIGAVTGLLLGNVIYYIFG
jgi:hypothetical protein